MMSGEEVDSSVNGVDMNYCKVGTAVITKVRLYCRKAGVLIRFITHN